MKVHRAKEIAEKLTNHGDWRSHGRSIKIWDLEESVQLQVIKIDDSPELAELVYRIHTVVRMLFSKSSVYKVFASRDAMFQKIATSQDIVRPTIPNNKKQEPEVVEVEVICPQCNEKYLLYAKLYENPKIDHDFKEKGALQFPKDNILRCKCDYEIDLSGLRNDIETKIGKKLIFTN